MLVGVVGGGAIVQKLGGVPNVGYWFRFISVNERLFTVTDREEGPLQVQDVNVTPENIDNDATKLLSARGVYRQI